MPRESAHTVAVSIVVPFYNVEDYIGECLDTLTSQSMERMEILLVDDCSPDGSLAVAEAYARRDARIRILRCPESMGQGGARNLGVEQARGEYVWFVDSDDLIRTCDGAESVYLQARRNAADVVTFDHWHWREPGVESGLCRGARGPDGLDLLDNRLAIRDFVHRNVFQSFVIWDKIWRREFLLKHECRFLERTFCQDSIHLLWYLNAQRISYLEQVLYHYRTRPESSVTYRKSAADYQHVCRISEQLESYLERLPDGHFEKTIVLVKKLNLLLRQTFGRRCFRDSSEDDRASIVEQCSQSIRRSRFMNDKRLAPVVRSAFAYFSRNPTYAALESAILRRDETALCEATRMILNETPSPRKPIDSLKRWIKAATPYGIVRKFSPRGAPTNHPSSDRW